MQEGASQPLPGPSEGPSPIKRSFSDNMALRHAGPSPSKRHCVAITDAQIHKEIERLVKKEAFLENQLLHLIQDLHKRYDEERQAIAEEQRRLANRLIEINENLRSEEQTVRERSSVKISEVREELAELRKNVPHEVLTSSRVNHSDISSHPLRGPREEVANEVLPNSTAGREDVGSAAHFEHALSTSQQSEVAQSSPEVHQQPNEESDGEISSSSDILILQAAGLLAEIGEAAHTGELKGGQQLASSSDTKGEASEAVADSTDAVPKEDIQERKDTEKDLAITKLKAIGTVFEEELQCSICNELLVAAVTINCAHSFCKYCLGQWKKQRAECPMCRVAITAEHRSVTLDSVISTLVGQLSVELQQRHKEVQEERAAIDAANAAASAAPAPTPAPAPAGRQPYGHGHGAGPANGRGYPARGHHNWQPPQHPHHPYAHPHAHPPHAHPPHALPPHAHPQHAHPPLAHPPHAHPPPLPPHALPPPAHTHAPPPHAHALVHAQPGRAQPGPGPADSPEHHLRVRRRNGRDILSSGSSSGSSSEEPSDSQSSYSSSGGYSNSSDNSWFDGQYMSAEYDEDDSDYGPREVPGIPGRYYGGYGVCFYCNQRGHWSNGCPVRFGGF